MKKLFLFLVLVVAYLVHAKTSFSEPRVTKWLLDHEAKAMSGDMAACDNYTDDVEVTLMAQGRKGRWEVEGGKNELCGYLKQAAAALTVMQASTQSEFTDFEIVRSSFPWITAQVKYREITHIRIHGMRPFTVTNEDSLILVRTLKGLKIKKLESKSTEGI